MDKLPRVILPVLLTLVLLVTGCSTGSEPSGPQAGKPAPDFQLQDLEGQTVSLSGLRGSLVMLNFWATWCPPCREEMPLMQEIYEEWSGKGLILLTIDIGESLDKVEDFMENSNLALPVLLDARGVVAQQYNVTGIPSTFFIDKDGIIQGKVVGAFPSEESIEQYLSKIVP